MFDLIEIGFIYCV